MIGSDVIFLIVILLIPLFLTFFTIALKDMKVKNILITIAGIIILFFWIDFYNESSPEEIINAKNSRVVVALGIMFHLLWTYTNVMVVAMLLTLFLVGRRARKLTQKHTVFNFIFIAFLFLLPYIVKYLSQYAWVHRNL